MTETQQCTQFECEHTFIEVNTTTNTKLCHYVRYLFYQQTEMQIQMLVSQPKGNESLHVHWMCQKEF